MIKNFINISVIGLMLAQITSMLAKVWWIFELFSHYQHYFFIIGIIILPALLIRKRFITILILVPILSIQLATLSPYLIKTEKSSVGDFKVLSSNFYIYNNDFDALRDVIAKENPDLFTVLEINSQWATEKEKYREIYPYIEITKEFGPHGMILFSKAPISIKEKKLGDYASFDAITEINGKPVRILIFHPKLPSTEENANKRNIAFEALSGSVMTSQLPTIVMGDFNSAPWSPYFSDIIKTTHLKEARIGFGMTPTWNSRNILFSLPIDHILVSDSIKVPDFHTGNKTGSDHLPVVAELSLR